MQAARRAAERYSDYKVALADGFRIFMPDRPQKQYHFTNYKYAFEAARAFNPEHPTSLLYEKNGEGYKLIGVMYTARKSATQEDLDARVPLSIAQWHAHVNLCLPPPDKRQETLDPHLYGRMPRKFWRTNMASGQGLHERNDGRSAQAIIQFVRSWPKAAVPECLLSRRCWG